jgi:pimeloyl-ACP methyl ester carboxylesterase
LRRVLRYYAGESVRAPDGSSPTVKAHPYGGRVMAATYAELFFERGDIEIGRRALRDWLDGRYSDARAGLPELSAAGRDRFAIITDNTRRKELGALLLGAAAEREADLLAVSPASGLSSLRVPSFLVHGASDPIVPSLETQWLAQEVPRSALRAALVTPVLRHAELSEPPSAKESFEIVSFVASFLEASRP